MTDVRDPAATDLDPHEFLSRDPRLGPLVDQHGVLTVEPAENFFERFVDSILRQQVSMASAAAIRERLYDAVDVTPEGVLRADEAVLREAGLSRQKTEYVRNIARAFRDRGYSRAYFEAKTDDEVVAELTTIKGVGEWTANMQLMFSLGRPDVFPVGDLGVRKGMRNLYGDLGRDEMVEKAATWRPYRSYATLYLWQAQEDTVEAVAEVRQE